MITFQAKMKGYTYISIIFGFVFLVGALLTPFQPHFLGLFLGFTASYISLWTIYRKTAVVGEISANPKNISFISYALAGFGIVIRYGLAIFAVTIAFRYPDAVHLLSVIAGLSLIYVIILLDMIIQFVRKR
ncbi:ATP synthase subunit I [Alkalihalobacillus sp. LMS39]|uniref:ATP synthase subunit I n=1 Tax=Alkalihalobacillus sp. LMS39 TaxID=2924032 RepID=UPI001FB1C99B|nr:ATP synthase subunit I [Alkalihalobacillus sp. LMS39]UOE93947.1 ATP synthase subunit I [Alkalihalobacillus sp. LMS39]